MGIRNALSQVAKACSEASGISLFPVEMILKARTNRQGEATWEARLGYRGPLSTPGIAKVRFDLTRFERVVAGVARRTIFHPYPDSLPPDAAITCYSIDELLAEKTRALIERTLPRDLYDVVLLLDNNSAMLSLPSVRDVLAAKCRAKNLSVPTAIELMAIVQGEPELRSEWENMLRHQLPGLPDIDDVMRRLGPLLS